MAVYPCVSAEALAKRLRGKTIWKRYIIDRGWANFSEAKPTNHTYLATYGLEYSIIYTTSLQLQARPKLVSQVHYKHEASKGISKQPSVPAGCILFDDQQICWQYICLDINFDSCGRWYLHCKLSTTWPWVSLSWNVVGSATSAFIC